MKKWLLSALVGLAILLNSAAFASTTTHYSLVLPTVGANQNTWGTLLNTVFNTLDTDLWAVSGGTTISINAPSSSASNITLTNPMASTQALSFSSGSLKLILPAMNATQSMVVGGILTVTNTGSNSFSIVANDTSTNVVSSVAPGNTVYVQLATNSTTNGTFNVYGPYLTSVGTLSLGTSASATNPARSGEINTGFFSDSSGIIKVADLGVTALQINGLSSGVDWLNVSAGKSGSPVFIGIAGASTNQNLSINAAGTGVIELLSNTTTTTQSAGDTSTMLATDAFVNTTALTLATGTTAVTQSAGDTSTDVATDAFVNTTALTLASGTTAVTQSSSDSSTKVATTAFVKNAAPVFFSSQNVVTGSRAPSTVYHNTTGKTMFVSVSIGAGGSGAVIYSDSNSSPSTIVNEVGSNGGPLSFMVLNGNYYEVATGSVINIWTEWY